MINKNTVVQSLIDTLNADVTLCKLLKAKTGSGPIFVGPDFPPKPPQRFVVVSVLSAIQDVDETKFETTSLGITIAVKSVVNNAGDDIAYWDIASRIDTLLDETPTALTLPNDLISNISHTDGLPPDTETISATEYLVGQERYELLTTAKV